MPSRPTRLLLLAGLSCAHPQKSLSPSPVSDQKAAPTPVFDAEPVAAGLGFTLREVAADAPYTPSVVAPSTPLPTSAVTALLARAPAMDGAADGRKPFALRERSLPPPRTGETVLGAFPSEADRALPAASAEELAPLSVLRRSPEGEVPVAPNLSVSFSRPMIAVSTQTSAAAKVPVVLTPEVPGDWRWLGTKTLLFAPKGRFPAATSYTVSIPEAVSADGERLAATSWTFATPALSLARVSRGSLSRSTLPRGLDRLNGDTGPQPLNPVLGLAFDQKIDPAALLPLLSLRPDVPVRLATEAEIKGDPALSLWSANPDLSGRFMAVVPTVALQADTGYTLTLQKGAPSAEGPRLSTDEQVMQFRTYPPLRVLDTRCWAGTPCPPSAGWYVELANPLDTASFDPNTITVEPAVPGFSVVAAGNSLQISGAFEGRRTYTVTLPAALKDIFGQTLGRDTTVRLDIGPAERQLTGPPSPMVVVDPAGDPGVSFFTINSRGLRVKVHAVTPDDWGAWTNWNARYRWEDAKRPVLPGRLVHSGTISIPSNPDRRQETRVPLAPHLNEGTGMFLVQVEPVEPFVDRWNRQEWIGWVQVTKLGITAFTDADGVVAWVNDLASGRPTAGASVSLLGNRELANTDSQGLASLKLLSSQGLVVRSGTDTALLVNDPYAYGNTWEPYSRGDDAAWYVFDEKGLYKPGETAHIRGVLRRVTPGPDGDVSALRDPKVTVTWSLISSMGNTLGSGTAAVSAMGGFSIEAPLPATPDLGQARLELYANGAAVSSPYYSHPLNIQEYRTPEFEVSTEAAAGPYTLGEDTTVDLDAHYYAGGALPNAPVTWTATASPASFRPPNHDAWSFGPWAPWWWSGPDESGATTSQTLTGTTDSLGQHHLGLSFNSVSPARPYSVHVEATVMDVNRQAWTSSEDLLVHPSDLYVGLRTARPWVDAKAPVTLEAMVSDRDGVAQTGVPITLTMSRLAWKNSGATWKMVEEDPQSCQLESAGVAVGQIATCALTPTTGGQYVVRGTIKDSFGRANQTELRLWVGGGEQAPDRGVAQETVTLLPEKKLYAPGETASFSVQAPFFPAEGTLTVRRDGLVSTQQFRMESSATTLSVPIAETWLPDVTVQVDLVGQQKRKNDRGEDDPALAPRVAYATGALTFDVSTAARKLGVAVTPTPAELTPAGTTSISLQVTDAAGAPVSGAELAVVVVDEAVLALSGYQLPDPLEVFYRARGAGVSDFHSRAWVNLTTPELANMPTGGLGMNGAGEGGGGAADGRVLLESAVVVTAASADMPVARRMMSKSAEEAPSPSAPPPPPPPPPSPSQALQAASTPIAVRSDFRALALWKPEVTTDAAGRATVPLTLPDSLTRYRVMVVAMAGERQFGTGEADITARLPLMVRPSPPRFLNFGDQLELPVVLQNQTDQPMTVDVAIRATNLNVRGGAGSGTTAAGNTAAGKTATGTPASANASGRRVTVPAKDRVEVRFPASAEEAGKARAQVVAASVGAGSVADAASFELPVWTPATTEAFATYGVLDGDRGARSVRQPVESPSEVWPQFGGLSVTTSSTNLQALTDAFLYLVQYPFDCNEQRAARILGIAGLRDILHAFEAPDVPSKSELEALVASDLEALGRRQNGDGGWAFWRRGDPSQVYLSLEVAHALVRAEQKGYAVDPQMKQRALAYAHDVRSRLPNWYSQEAKWVLRAYGIYVTDLAGKPQVPAAKALLSEAGVERLPIEAQGLILATLHGGGATEEVGKIRSFLANRVTESAAGAHFVTEISDGAYVLLQSDRRADGVLLEALIRTDPKSDLIPKLVDGLLAHRRKGAWANTTENAAILLAMDRYFAVFEGVTPDFVARAWLGDAYVGDHSFVGRTTERFRTDVPMDWLVKHDDPDLVLQRDGAGRMYYRIALDYAPKSLQLAPADYGFAVTRDYEAVDDPGDVRRDPDGTVHVKAGARVRVKLTVASPMRRYHVALVDPLPAGFEVINPGLATSGAIPQDSSPDSGGGARAWWWWWRTWYEHENLRDDRVEAFTSLLWEGVYDYEYVARATTPGNFVVPPTKAEEMYTPETFGRAGSDRVIITLR